MNTTATVEILFIMRLQVQAQLQQAQQFGHWSTK
jgi:hypothetical protein